MYLYKRETSPYWWTEFTVKGNRFRRSTETASRRDAEAIARRLRDEAIAEARKAKSQPVEVLTLDKACGRYWIEHGRRLKDARNEARNLKYIVSTIGADTPLSEVSNRHVNAIVSKRLEMGAGPAGVNRTVSTLKTMMNRAAKRWEVAVRAISWSSHKLKEPKERIRYLTPDECRRLLDCLEKIAPHIAAIVHFLLLTGLRKAEAFGATWDKLDLARGVLTVRVKGGHEREVPLEAEAMHLLRELPQTGRYIFDTTNWRKHFDAGLKAAGIEDFHWHDLRHTFATQLGKSGAPIEVVSKALGHSSVAVTMKYRHVLHDEVRAAMQASPTLRPHTSNVIPIKKA